MYQVSTPPVGYENSYLGPVNISTRQCILPHKHGDPNLILRTHTNIEGENKLCKSFPNSTWGPWHVCPNMSYVLTHNKFKFFNCIFFTLFKSYWFFFTNSNIISDLIFIIIRISLIAKEIHHLLICLICGGRRDGTALRVLAALWRTPFQFSLPTLGGS